MYQLPNGKGYLDVYIYSVGFYKWTVKIPLSIGAWSCVVDNAFSKFWDNLLSFKVLEIMT